MHETPLSKIVYAYPIAQPMFDEMLRTVAGLELHQGLPSELDLDGRPTTIVLGDLLRNDKRLAELFTKMRHQNVSTVFITQNLYFQSKYATTVTRNAQYLILFPNPRNASMIGTLSRQIYPRYSKFLPGAFEDATSKPYGYLFLDLKAETDSKLRVRTNVFPREYPTVYRPK